MKNLEKCCMTSKATIIDSKYEVKTKIRFFFFTENQTIFVTLLYKQYQK